ncbi:MAG: hypothetical protein SPH36_03330 [Candidatus Cryptobacteroides sp.]|nr:hypothetical protein [Candidatus Cryptobacteroides sp.]
MMKYKIREYTLQYHQSGKQLDMMGYKVTPVNIMRRLFSDDCQFSVDQPLNNKMFALLCGKESGLIGYLKMEAPDAVSIIKAALDAKAPAIIVGVRSISDDYRLQKVEKQWINELRLMANKEGILFVNYICLGPSKYYLYTQDQFYKY